MAEARSFLGIIFAQGLGILKNEAEALTWYRKSAERQDVIAQFNLGDVYRNGLGVSKDEAEAVKFFYKVADQGYANTHITLASCMQ